MLDLQIPAPVPFHFRDVVFSHGWLRLPPFTWDAETETLARVQRLPSGALARLELRAAPDGAAGVSLRIDASPANGDAAIACARWMLALDEEFSGFHRLCAGNPGLREAAERGQGRILRCPTVWEDLVKTHFSVNTTWRQTVAMTQHLVRLAGEPYSETERAFPEPEAVATLAPEAVQAHCRVGYRAEPLVSLAREIAEGRLDLEALKDPALSDAEVEARLRSLRGIGPYAAANVMMLLGRYDHLPVDSWFRTTVRNGWFGGRDVPDREMVVAFEPYRPYRTLVYRFYDWDGAMRTQVWTREGE